MSLSNRFIFGFTGLMMLGAATHPADVMGFYKAAYPSDLAKREALRTCQQSSLTFVRFLESDRNACYARVNTAWNTAGQSHDDAPASMLASASVR